MPSSRLDRASLASSIFIEQYEGELAGIRMVLIQEFLAEQGVHLTMSEIPGGEPISLAIS